MNAGPNLTIAANQSATLDGFVYDDGLPDPSNSVTTSWTKVSGPGTVTFANAVSSITTATFSAQGSYTLRLTANDGSLTGTDDVVVAVGQALVNQPPVVDAGPDLALGIAQSPTIHAIVTDDSLPAVPGVVTKQWSKVSGPSTVTFGTPTAVDTTVTFGALGTYVLRMTAFDGLLTTTDDVQAVVTAVPPNTAPVVNAGTDQTALVGGILTLNGSFTDDNNPVPSSSVTTTWSKQSGPGVVSFANPALLSTGVSFGQSGTYVLQLDANDTALTGTDTLTVTVLDTPPSQTLSFQDGLLPTPAYAGTRDTKTFADLPTTTNGTTSKIEVDGSPDTSSYINGT